MCFIYTRCAPTILLSSGVKFPVTPMHVGLTMLTHSFSFIHRGKIHVETPAIKGPLIFPQPRLNIAATTFGPLSAHFLVTMVERSSERSEVTLLEASVASLGRFRTTEGLL